MRRVFELLGVAVLTGIVVSAINYYTHQQKESNFLQSNKNTPVRHVNYGANMSTDFTAAASMAVDQVVHVMSSGSQTVNYASPFDFFFGGGGIQQHVPTMSSGSGVVISSDGYIVTNNHVVKGANEIEVIFNNKKTYKAKLIGKDEIIDLALLKIDATDLVPMPYGNSDLINVGEWVLAIGNPFNLNSTVTAGIVSAKARSLGMSSRTSLEAFIQTDAAVNPGNSGGALINTKGELIGINTAIASQTGSYVGYSFALPVNIVKKVVADLMEFGEVQRALLGVSIYELNASTASQLGVKNLEGVYVKEVTPGGAAEDAKIKVGDVIVKINNISIKNSSELYEQIGTHRPGNKITVTLIRGDDEKIFDMVLKNQYNLTTMSKAENIDILGAKFKVLSAEELSKMGLKSGVQITQLSPGKLMKKGMQEGFIITAINQEPVKDATDIQNIINKSSGGILIEGHFPNGTRAYYAIGLDE